MTPRASAGGVTVTAGRPGAKVLHPEPAAPAGGRGDPEAGVTRRQFLIGGGAVLAAAAALGVVGRRSWRVRDGVTPFAVAAVQASDTYWHRRAAGDDAMAMLFDEFIPLLRDEHGLSGPVAIMGWSMGGYGALRAAELHPQQFCAVCGVSAALWRSFDDGVGDAFDSAADYAANDISAHAATLSGLAVRVDCGLQDPFCEADKAFAEALPRPPGGGFSPGGHNDDYWSRVAPAEIDWLGDRLGRTLA
jgi:pimeloyl-ACP methyl ester carboxylesterase